ncbi:Sec8 exocyst complex component specific domain protein [Necator americanus]|uniref:Exocyst complex component Sec8 n=1 Tax=Necator americanus TaxID=51031 RepID=W2TWS0_NECAM|nr:Sec8 exocyst complex component specific domain protein [Necator americanus]ETN86530.1 Sec8 exocyst complex component specific domain protein [Necator americanus]
MSSSGGAPVPARRTLHAEKQSVGPSTGLLINVIRSLTTSVSEDQRELEKSRLQKGFQESETLIDKLVKSHQKDVEECLDSFRDVSTRISACRERIHNVRNALHTCKTHLECRRDDLKKLWLENSQQKHICELMAQLDELKEAPLKIDVLVNQGNYTDAAKITSTSRDLLNTRLAKIEGLSQLRTMIRDASDRLTEKIVDQIVDILVVDPFESHMFDLVQSMSEQRVMESEQCSRLHEKARRARSLDPVESRLKLVVAALSELGGGSVDIDRVMTLSRAQIDKQVTASVSLMRIRASIDENLAGDQTHLTQLVQMIVCQLESSRAAHKVLEKVYSDQSGTNIMKSYWEGAQNAVEALVSDHLDITPLAAKEPIDSKKPLFRFDSTAFASGTSTTDPSMQSPLVVCRPSAFNIVPMFPWLRKMMDAIEKETGESPCQLRRKVLPSCERVLELCQEVHGLIVSMDLYADRFAALWLLVLTDYNKNVTDMYERTTKSLSEVDGVASRRKISAAWAADEDISRLLMSLPNWLTAATEATPSTPSVPNFESEKDIRQRNERESEILIGNLATQKKIDRAELLTDMGDVRALAALHESLRWFACEVRKLIATLPQHVKATLRGCMVQVRFKDGQITDNEPVLEAMEDCISRLDTISDTCLLMLHLELRVHCFFHLLPLARPRNVSVHEELDPEVVELGRDLQSFHQLLSSILSQPKLRYIFDGLGHLCAAIFIHSSQHMPRLSEAGKKRVCRNIWGVQQRLSQITSRREAELDRARAFFELLAHEPDRLLAQLPDRRSQFTPVEMGHLVALSVRSHPTLASQHGALEQRLAQLSALLKQPV